MITEGDIVLFRFPQTDLSSAKLRPALLIKKIPNRFEDWFVCMISTQIHQQIEDLEWVFPEEEIGFDISGLKKTSLFRLSRLAVVDASIFEGRLGTIGGERLKMTKEKLSNWITKLP
jgi:mRNA interferase MazF